MLLFQASAVWFLQRFNSTDLDTLPRGFPCYWNMDARLNVFLFRFKLMYGCTMFQRNCSFSRSFQSVGIKVRNIFWDGSTTKFHTSVINVISLIKKNRWATERTVSLTVYLDELNISVGHSNVSLLLFYRPSSTGSVCKAFPYMLVVLQK